MVIGLALLLGSSLCRPLKNMDEVIREGEGYVSRLNRMADTVEQLTMGVQGPSSNK